MKLMVTGGCGFIGSHFVEYCLRNHPDWKIVNVDALTYAAHPDTGSYLKTIAPERYDFVELDIAAEELLGVMKKFEIEAIVNFAAETHVDRSILDPDSFVRANIVGVQNLLQNARVLGNLRLVQVSTDEVYGSLTSSDQPFTESSPIQPNSPYAASKASADLLALASARTFGQDVLITRCSNNFGPYQFPEKLLPLVIANALENKTVPVYGDGKQVRDWIYVKDHCSAVDTVLQKGTMGEVYNISATTEMPNLEIIRKTLDLLGKPRSLIEHVGDRPAHDRRYALNSDKIAKELGWKPSFVFGVGLKETIDWYLSHENWWKKLRDKNYYQYYEANYENKYDPMEGEDS